MPDGIPYHDPSGYWHFGDWETDVRTGPKRNATEQREQVQALRALVPAEGHVIYAIELSDGVIKIGVSANFVNRRNAFPGHTILGFRPGTLDEEHRIHKGLVEHRARGREYYHPVPEVIAVVNDIRDYFNLPHLAA